MTDFRALCAELVDCLEKANWPLRHKTVFGICLDNARAALAQSEPQGPGRPAIEPVPVTERLPGPEDCDAEGRCWWLIRGCKSWAFARGADPTCGSTHWLPHHALPVPQQEADHG